MKKILFLVLVSCFLNSCSSDSGTSSTLDNDTVLLRKIISTSSSQPGNYYTNTYTYNGKKLTAININDNTVFRFFYTGDLITSRKDYFQGNLQGTLIYQYDASNRLIKWTEYIDAPETRINRQMEFHYNTDGAITVNGLIFDNGENELSPIVTEKYFLNSNDEVERIEFQYPNGTQVMHVVYDGKHNPFKNVIGFKAINGFNVKACNSNITSITYSGFDSGYNYLTTESKTYNYNGDDFPIAGTRSFPNDTSMPIMTDQYIYE